MNSHWNNQTTNDKSKEPKKQFDEPIFMDFQTRAYQGRSGAEGSQGGCPIADVEGNCLVSGVFEDSAPIGGA